MLAFLSGLLPLISGLAQPVKDYFNYKKEIRDKNHELDMARLTAETQAVVAGKTARTEQIKSYLSAVSMNFRQFSFFFFMIPFVISMFFPEYAKIMWTNFYAIPEEFRYMFMSIYSVIWGLPIADNYISRMFGSINRVVESKREYKIKKYNAKAYYDVIRKTFYSKGGIPPAAFEVHKKALEELGIKEEEQ
tara:strand:- start:11430 stop:12002 length:573 start_codon:yes stop_codon:yes gene_type:complete